MQLGSEAAMLNMVGGMYNPMNPRTKKLGLGDIQTAQMYNKMVEGQGPIAAYQWLLQSQGGDLEDSSRIIKDAALVNSFATSSGVLATPQMNPGINPMLQASYGIPVAPQLNPGINSMYTGVQMSTDPKRNKSPLRMQPPVNEVLELQFLNQLMAGQMPSPVGGPTQPFSPEELIAMHGLDVDMKDIMGLKATGQTVNFMNPLQMQMLDVDVKDYVQTMVSLGMPAESIMGNAMLINPQEMALLYGGSPSVALTPLDMMMMNGGGASSSGGGQTPPYFIAPGTGGSPIEVNNHPVDTTVKETTSGPPSATTDSVHTDGSTISVTVGTTDPATDAIVSPEESQATEITIDNSSPELHLSVTSGNIDPQSVTGRLKTFSQADMSDYADVLALEQVLSQTQNNPIPSSIETDSSLWSNPVFIRTLQLQNDKRSKKQGQYPYPSFTPPNYNTPSFTPPNYNTGMGMGVPVLDPISGMPIDQFLLQQSGGLDDYHKNVVALDSFKMMGLPVATDPLTIAQYGGLDDYLSVLDKMGEAKMYGIDISKATPLAINAAGGFDDWVSHQIPAIPPLSMNQQQPTQFNPTNVPPTSNMNSNYPNPQNPPFNNNYGSLSGIEFNPPGNQLNQEPITIESGPTFRKQTSAQRTATLLDNYMKYYLILNNQLGINNIPENNINNNNQKGVRGGAIPGGPSSAAVPPTNPTNSQFNPMMYATDPEDYSAAILFESAINGELSDPMQYAMLPNALDKLDFSDAQISMYMNEFSKRNPNLGLPHIGGGFSFMHAPQAPPAEPTVIVSDSTQANDHFSPGTPSSESAPLRASVNKSVVQLIGKDFLCESSMFVEPYSMFVEPSNMEDYISTLAADYPECHIFQVSTLSGVSCVVNDVACKEKKSIGTDLYMVFH